MKPKPFSALNHFTVPCAITAFLHILLIATRGCLSTRPVPTAILSESLRRTREPNPKYNARNRIRRPAGTFPPNTAESCDLSQVNHVRPRRDSPTTRFDARLGLTTASRAIGAVGASPLDWVVEGMTEQRRKTDTA